MAHCANPPSPPRWPKTIFSFLDPSLAAPSLVCPVPESSSLQEWEYHRSLSEAAREGWGPPPGKVSVSVTFPSAHHLGGGGLLAESSLKLGHDDTLQVPDHVLQRLGPEGPVVVDRLARRAHQYHRLLADSHRELVYHRLDKVSNFPVDFLILPLVFLEVLFAAFSLYLDSSQTCGSSSSSWPRL